MVKDRVEENCRDNLGESEAVIASDQAIGIKNVKSSQLV